MIEKFSQFTRIDKNINKEEFENQEQGFVEGVSEIKDLVDKNGNALSLSDIEKVSNLEFSQLTKHLAHEKETKKDLFKSFRNSISQIFNDKFKTLFNKLSKTKMTKASVVALMVALNLSPEEVAEQTKIENENNVNEKEIKIKDEIDESENTYYASDKDFENLGPLDNLVIKDNDLFARGNQEFIEKHEVEVEQKFFEIGKEKFLINVLSKEGPNKQIYFICHDSEDASFDTALRAIENGGQIIALGNNENRFLYSYGEKKGITDQDPNRMFDKNNPYWPLAEKILDLLKVNKNKNIIALHNNHPEGDFNLDNIKKWRNIIILSEKDPNRKSLIWLPGLDKIPNEELKNQIEYFKNNGLNVVYEYVPENEIGDGSFSVYAAQNNINYINIETQMGNLKDQQRYLKVVENYEQINKAKMDIYAMDKN